MEEIIKQEYDYISTDLKANKENASITEKILKALMESDKTISVKEALTILDDSKKLLLMITECR